MSTGAPTRRADTSFWKREYWLDHCEGYRVSTCDGCVGFVEDVVRDAETEQPTAIAVRRSTGDRGVAVIPITHVAEMRPETEDLVLAAGADVA